MRRAPLRVEEASAVRLRQPPLPAALAGAAGAVRALQRTAGNRAVAALLAGAARGGGARPALQRAIDPAERADFAERYDRLLAQLRGSEALTKEQGDEIRALAKLARTDDGWLHREVPHLWDDLLSLVSLERGEWGAMSPRSVVDTFIGTPRRNYEGVAPATFSVQVEGGSGPPGTGAGGGGFAHAGLAAQEAQRIKQLERRQADLPEVEARFEIVLAEIDRAYHAHRRFAGDEHGGLERTALVFVGPEWFFRRPDRPYTQKEMTVVLDRIRAISRVYPDMVIMPGTIIWWMLEGGRWAALSNTAPVVWMGEMVGLIHKASNCGDVEGLVTADAFSRAASGQADSLFDVANLRFAIDICVDHFDKRARHEYEALHGKESLQRGGGVDVHLVTGAGQLADSRSVAARPGGVVISADAGGSGEKANVVTKAPSRDKVSSGRKKRYETGMAEMDLLEGRPLSYLQYPVPPHIQAFLAQQQDPTLAAREQKKAEKPVTTLYAPQPITVNVVEARKGKLLETRRK